MTSVLLINTKFVHNVGGTVRAVSCFGPGTVYFTGNRVDLGNRLPREERMKAYANTPWRHLDPVRPITTITREHAPDTLTPVAIELLPNSQPLITFDHPEDALYVFGPEDGALPKGIRTMCHQFVTIPSFHCLNLAAAVYITLYDRMVKRVMAGLEEAPTVESEQRGWWHSPAIEGTL